MAVTPIAANASISTAIAAGANDDIFTLAAGTYRGQTFTPKPGQQFWGEKAGRTVISGARSVTTWTSGSGQFYATQASYDGNSNVALPDPISQAKFVGSISGTTLTVSSVVTGTVQDNWYVYGANVVPGTRITGGSGSTWTVTPSQTVSSTTMVISGWRYLQVASGGEMSMAREDLYVDGVRYTRVMPPGPATAGTWWFDIVNKRIYVSTNLTGHVVEYACTPNIYGEYIEQTGGAAVGTYFENITFEKFATDMLGVFWGVHGWTWKNCAFQHNHMTGLHIGSGCKIDGCYITDNGLYGIVNGDFNGPTTVTSSEISFTGWGKYDLNSDGGGFKLVNCAAVVTDNHIHDNSGSGAWFDIDCAGCIIARNLVTNNDGAGIFYEISWGNTKIFNNTCSNNSAAQIYISNSSGCEVYGNVCYVKPGNANSNAGIVALTQDRGTNSAGATPQVQSVNVHDNLIIHTADTSTNGVFCYKSVTNPSWLWNNNQYVVPGSGSYWIFDNSNGLSGGTGTKTWAALQVNQTYETGPRSSATYPSSPT